MTTTAQNDGAGLRRAIRAYFIVYAIYGAAGPFYSVFPIFMAVRGLNQLQINTVVAVYMLVWILTDVPTGAFADALGRRRSLVLGCGLRAASCVIYFFSYRFSIFLLAELVDGIGTSFGNGAIDAWGVDALDVAGFAGLKDRLFSRLLQAATGVSMISVVVGAYIADRNIALPWLCAAAGFVVAGAVGATFMRDPARRVKLSLIEVLRGVAARTAEGWRAGLGSRTLRTLTLGDAFAYAGWSPFMREWQILFNSRYNVGLWIIGWLECAQRIARIAGAELAARTSADSSRRASRLSWITVAGALLLGAAGLLALHSNAALIAILAMTACIGAMNPIVMSWLNEEIPAERRATLLSFNSTGGRIGGIAGLLAGGYVADHAGIPAQWIMSMVVCLCAAPFYLTARRPGEGAAAEAADTPAG